MNDDSRRASEYRYMLDRYPDLKPEERYPELFDRYRKPADQTLAAYILYTLLLLMLGALGMLMAFGARSGIAALIYIGGAGLVPAGYACARLAASHFESVERGRQTDRDRIWEIWIEHQEREREDNGRE